MGDEEYVGVYRALGSISNAYGRPCGQLGGKNSKPGGGTLSL